MAFSPVSWQDRDEITSAKLNQMNDNDLYLKSQLITAAKNVNIGLFGIIPSNQGISQTQATKIIGVETPFISLQDEAYHDVYADFPAGFFTTIPIVTCSPYSIHGDAYSHVLIQNESLTTAIVRIFKADLATGHLPDNLWHFEGNVNFIAIGN